MSVKRASGVLAALAAKKVPPLVWPAAILVAARVLEPPSVKSATAHVRICEVTVVAAGPPVTVHSTALGALLVTPVACSTTWNVMVVGQDSAIGVITVTFIDEVVVAEVVSAAKVAIGKAASAARITMYLFN